MRPAGAGRNDASGVPASRAGKIRLSPHHGLNQSPNPATWIPRGWSRISAMLLVECDCTVTCSIEITRQIIECFFSQTFPSTSRRPHKPCCLITLEVCRLVLEVEEEPKLYTWIGDRRLHTMPPGKLHRLGNKGMDVNVEDAPILIMGAPPTSTILLLLELLDLDSPLHQKHRRSVIIGNIDETFLPQTPLPIQKICLLRHRTLHPHEERLAPTASS